MYNFRDNHGELMFSTSDWLQPQQIASYFSGLARSKTQGDQDEEVAEQQDNAAILQNIIEAVDGQ